MQAFYCNSQFESVTVKKDLLVIKPSVSFTACFPVYVEDMLTARTSVIGILEIVHK